MANMKNTKERRIFLAFTITIAIIFIGSYFYSSNQIELSENEIYSLSLFKNRDTPYGEQQKNKLREALGALTKANTATLYSLEPKNSQFAENPLLKELENNPEALPYSPPPKYHYGELLLGQTQLTSAEVKVAAQEFRKAIGGGRVMCACWEPRHAIRVEHSGHLYDFVLCYSCSTMHIHKDGAFFLSLGGSREGKPEILNQLLKNHSVPLPYIFTEKAREDHNKKEQLKQDEKGRWLDTFPDYFKPLWNEDLASDNYETYRERQLQREPFREALKKKFPEKEDQILALIEWRAKANKWWDSYEPRYQKLSQDLLLNFETEDIIKALRNKKLSYIQKEGAARLILDLRHERKDELKLLPQNLKKILLDHITNTQQNKETYKFKAAKEILGNYPAYELTECSGDGYSYADYSDNRHHEVSTNLSWIKSNKNIYFKKEDKWHRMSFSSNTPQSLKYAFSSGGELLSFDRRFILFHQKKKEEGKERALLYDTHYNQETLVFQGALREDKWRKTYESPRFSFDSTKLALIDFSENIGDILVVTLEDKNISRIPFPESISFPTHSKGGGNHPRGLLYWSEDGENLYIQYYDTYYRLNLKEKKFKEIEGYYKATWINGTTFVEDGVEAQTRNIVKGAYEKKNWYTSRYDKLNTPSGELFAEINSELELYVKKENREEGVFIEKGEGVSDYETSIHIIDWIEGGKYLLYEFRGRVFVYGIEEKKKAEIQNLRCLYPHWGLWFYDAGILNK